MNPARRLEVLFRVSLLALVGCSPGASPSTPQAMDKTAVPPAPKAADGPDAAKPEGGFYKLSWNEAFSKARADQKFVMVEFHADWCGPCRDLDAETWKDAAVQNWLVANTVAIKIDIDDDIETAAKYKIQGVPTMVFFKPNGTIRRRIVGFVDAETFLTATGPLGSPK